MTTDWSASSSTTEGRVSDVPHGQVSGLLTGDPVITASTASSEAVLGGV